MARFDSYTHGFWILGAIFAFLGAMIAGNVEFIEGATTVSYGVSVLLAFALLAVAGALWISAGSNYYREEVITTVHDVQECVECEEVEDHLNIHKREII